MSDWQMEHRIRAIHMMVLVNFVLNVAALVLSISALTQQGAS